MRFKRELLLFASAALVTMAFTATPTASATSLIEVTQGDGTTHCPSLGSLGCTSGFAGEVTIFFHILGFEGAEAKCRISHTVYIDEDGNGQVANQTVTPFSHDTDCSNSTYPPCTFSLPWTMFAEKDADGVVRAHYDVCIDPAESGTCSGELVTTVTESGGSFERQNQTATDTRIGSTFCELTLGMTATGQDIHIKSI